MRDPKLLAFMKKFTLKPHPDYNEAVKKDPTSRLSRIEVTARGKVFKKETAYARGTQFNEEYMFSDQELADKFRNNASRVLPWPKIDKAVDAFMELEKVKDVSSLVELLTA